MKRIVLIVGLAVTVNAIPAHAETRPNIVSCKQIKTPAQLAAIGTNATTLAASYCLGGDIDLSAVPNWSPIGSTNITGGGPFFTGQFYGNGHVIRNLTILTSGDSAAFGLFSVLAGGLVQDVGIVNAKVTVTTTTGAYAGALAGAVAPLATGIAPPTVSNVYSTGMVSCNGSNCAAGGLLGVVSNATVQDAWSSAAATSDYGAGGLVGVFSGSTSGTYRRLYATGNVTGASTAVAVGGLSAGFTSCTNGCVLEQAYATGKVRGGTGTFVGGLLGELTGSTNLASGVYATGPVVGGASAKVGGLIGLLTDATLTQAFSAGKVTGGTMRGGLIGQTTGTPTVADAYWDSVTSGQATSAGSEVGKSTTQLRSALPTGFTGAWGITASESYPFLNLPGNFSSTLATLAVSGKVFAFLPISQLDKSQYHSNPAHADQASLAAVYTMIGRAVGITDNVSTLINVKIDKYFWHDSSQTTTFSPSPLTSHATLGAMKTIAAATHLNNTNVIGQMNVHRLVILRGTYTKPGGGTATHYMLGTLYTKSGTAVLSVVADDPWTGTQVEISPATKKVITASFPLANFKVDGFQAVTGLN